MSYFAKKRETEAVIVQTLGSISTYVVIVQLAMAESMPMPQFLATSAVVAAGLLLNLLNYLGWLPGTLWQLWEDFMTIGGLAVLPQVTITAHLAMLMLMLCRPMLILDMINVSPLPLSHNVNSKCRSCGQHLFPSSPIACCLALSVALWLLLLLSWYDASSCSLV
jgi:hypothetical protein